MSITNAFIAQNSMTESLMLKFRDSKSKKLSDEMTVGATTNAGPTTSDTFDYTGYDQFIAYTDDTSSGYRNFADFTYNYGSSGYVIGFDYDPTGTAVPGGDGHGVYLVDGAPDFETGFSMTMIILLIIAVVIIAIIAIAGGLYYRKKRTKLNL